MIFVAVYVILSTLAIYTITEFSRCPGGEKRILLAVLMALPFIAVRIAYSVAVGFTKFGTFDTVEGSVEVRAFMSSFEEFVVIIAYTVIGLMSPQKYNGADREISEKRTESNSDLQGDASLAQPLHGHEDSFDQSKS